MIHPVQLIEPEVSSMFQRAMRKADLEHRFMEPGEEINHSHMSVAVSLRRIADSLDRLAKLAIIGLIGLALGLVILLLA
jgi:hypothetical protein